MIKRLILATTFLFAPISSVTAQNILLILTDDHGWSQMSVSMDPGIPSAKSTYLETPNMARLIQAGMRFSSGYSPAPLCTPTRRSILCGTSAARSGPEFPSKWVPKQHLTIPKALKLVNPDYRCAHFGKWGEQMASTPEECGYDASDGMTGNNTGGMPKTLGVNGSHQDGPPHFINNKDPKLTASITTRAIDFMRKQKQDGKPFYVQVSYYAQHLSVVTRDKTLAKYKEKGTPDRGYTEAWAAMMEELDDGVGRLLNAVDQLDATKDTYIFFTADNGGRGTVPGGDTARAATNTPLTGAKHSLYEGGIRVPFVVSGPGVLPQSVCRAPVAGYDFLPTFVALAGGKPAVLTDEVDGFSIKPLLTDPAAKLKRSMGGLVFHRPNRMFSALRDDQHKLMVFWKRNGDVQRAELYDVSENPTEEGRDIAKQQPDATAALKTKLLDYLKSVNADKPRQVLRRKGKGKKDK